MTINSQSILKDALTYMKNTIASGITDPISASRTSSSQFVMSTFPEARAEYPHITITTNYGEISKLGMQSIVMNSPVRFNIQVWSADMKNKDQLAGSIVNLIRQIQYGNNPVTGVPSGTVNIGLHNIRMLPTYDVDEVGKRGVHRKVIPVEYDFIFN